VAHLPNICVNKSAQYQISRKSVQ